MKPIGKEEKMRDGDEQEFMLDEAFLRRVDQTMLMDKRHDPHRLKDIWRALAEESRLANLTNAYGLEHLHLRREG